MELRRLASHEVDLHRRLRLRALGDAPDSFGEAYTDVAARPIGYWEELTRSVTEPGPNVMLVTLIGYHVAGIAGALVTTLAMCGPTAVLAYYVSGFLRRSSASRWPAIVQAALVPLSIGLMGASALILALTSDRNWVAALLTIVAATLAFARSVGPYRR
mgnify:CR=1 FL=1